MAAAETTPADLYTLWNTYYSNLLVAGAKIFIKIKNVNITKGWETVPDITSVEVTAS